MKSHLILFRRAGIYYCEDTTSGKQSSLRTRNESEAVAILNARNESFRQPNLNLQIARAYLTASDPASSGRTWQNVMDQIQTNGKTASGRDFNDSAASSNSLPMRSAAKGLWGAM